MEKNAILLVEGRCDVVFLENLCRLLDIQGVSILPPGDCGVENIVGGGVSKIPKVLPELLRDIEDGHIKKLAIVADADHTGINDGGFSERLGQLTAPIAEVGYTISSPPTQTYEGSLFEHPEGLPPVGLWLMPDHKNNGMLEDLVKQTVCDGQQRDLLDKAEKCLNELSVKLFEPEGRKHRCAKAIVYTWLAWQEKPGQGLMSTINPKKPEKNLIDLQSDEITAFKNWLNRVFT
ncbi:DUF3226 domain-containing protein [Candidatus Parabeggiatoa sp. HSG14]|uniref:DUF3226 domain-containing protein n=1 Tax=Candidatus Parabeggiatoa sp. HSG14 TaxID=3055593 RepID=UPI0025A760F9|nr:hypothetical protein [Thiotrichales bacterium HSG14]